MGLAVPNRMDGRVLLELFDQEFIAENTPRYEDGIAPDDLELRAGYSQEEEDLVRQRLRDLGYTA